MDITNIKRELYNKLRSDENVIGAGIKGSGKTEYIVIFVKQRSAQASLIPATFKGFKVKTEEQKMPKAMPASK